MSNKVSFRNTPTTEDRCGKGVVARANSIHNAIDQNEEWIQVEENKWLPKKSLAKLPSGPCAFYVLCTVLKTSQVTEINLSKCGLKPHAIFDREQRAHLRCADASMSSNESVSHVSVP